MAVAKAILELDEMPKACIDCKISDYITFDEGEEVSCPVLGRQVDGFLRRDKECPLKEIKLCKIIQISKRLEIPKGGC